MFKKFFILLMLNSVTAFSSSYTALSKEIQQCLDDLHKQAFLSNISEDPLEEIGKLYACLFIEKEMNLPENEDAIYIDEKERKLNLLEADDPKMQIVDCLMKSTLEEIGKLYACLFIEKEMNLPESEDAIYIVEKERKLNLLELNDLRMQVVDCQIKSTLEKIKVSDSKFSKAAEKCLKDFCR